MTLGPQWAWGGAEALLAGGNVPAVVATPGPRRDHGVMQRTKLYQRTAAQRTETLKILAYLDDAGGDDEIRVTHTIERQADLQRSGPDAR